MPPSVSDPYILLDVVADPLWPAVVNLDAVP